MRDFARRLAALERITRPSADYEMHARAFDQRMTELADRLRGAPLAIDSASPAELLASGNVEAFRDRVLAMKDEFLIRAFRLAEPEDFLV